MIKEKWYERKFLGVEAWHYYMGLASIGVITTGILVNSREEPKDVTTTLVRVAQKDSEPRENQSLVFYDILPSFNASVEDLGEVIRRYRDSGALTNYSLEKRTEDVIVEERDANKDKIWDVSTYQAQNKAGRWPVIGLNSNSCEYKSLLNKFGKGIAPSTHAISFYEK